MRADAAAFAILAAVSTASVARASEADIVMDLQAQIAHCWNMPPGASPHVTSVVIRVQLERNGSLKGAPAIVPSNQPEAAKMLAASALRAIRTCAPYRLPAEEYAIWKDLVIRFKPDLGD